MVNKIIIWPINNINPKKIIILQKKPALHV